MPTTDLDTADLDSLAGEDLRQAVAENFSGVHLPPIQTAFHTAWALLCQAPQGWSIGIRRSLADHWIAENGIEIATGPTPEVAIARVLLKAKRVEKR